MDKTYDRKPRLTFEQIESCLMHIFRVPELFLYAKTHLKPLDFDKVSEAWYGLVWSAALEVAARNNGELPQQGTESILSTELASKIRQSPGLVPEPIYEAAQGLISWIYSRDADKLNPEYYKPIIQDLIIERTVAGNLQRELQSFKDYGMPKNLIEQLNAYSMKMQNIMVDSSKLGSSPFTMDLQMADIGKFSTGIPWLDVYMNGGQAPEEVYTLMGPTGLGKTTLGVMIATQTARVWRKEFDEGKIPKKKVSCFFTWEQSDNQLRPRFISFAAEIDSNSLESYARGLSELSTTGNLKPYEIEEFKLANKGAPGAEAGLRTWPGEKERFEASVNMLGDYVKVFDFSGQKNEGIGVGGVDEVAAALRGLVNNGYEIGVVVMDYALIAARRLSTARNLKPEALRHILASWCNECRFKIACPFKCPVWVLQQLNTEANRRSPVAEQHHSYAAECGSFSENAWFAFVFTTKDKLNNTCRLLCTKERRAKGDVPPQLLKIDGHLCRLTDVNGTYEMIKETGTIAPRTAISSRERAEREEYRKRVEAKRPGASDLRKI